MKIIRNNVIPFRGFRAINLFGVLFVRWNAAMDGTDFNHEEIHTAQMREMLYVFFYLCQDCHCKREAYACESDMGYLQRRKAYAWFNYMKTVAV